MKVFEILNLNYKGLEKVKENYEKGNTLKALEELKNYYINRKSVYGFIDNIEKIVDYAKNNLKEEVQFMVSISEEVCNKEFVFNLPWEMERCHKKIIFNKEIDWNLNPFNDEEWTFMLNRHRYFFVLAESYLFTRDKRYIDTLKSLFKDWIDNNKLRKELKKTSWRTIEVGIRLKNWIKALEILLLENEIDEELLSKILLSINDQLIYIKENSNDSRVLSNWVILEQEGAFIAETFLPELKISSAYKDETINILEDAINLQVAEDGLHWEQSFQYHNEMVKCFFEILTIAENNNISLPSAIKKKTKDMVYGTLYTMKPNGCQSNYGDSDEESLKDIMNFGAVLFKEGTFKNYGDKKIDLNTLMTYGYKSILIFDKLENKELNYNSKAFEDTGLYFMRTGFSNNDSYSMFKCGFLGSGHGHSDMLHLEVTCNGEDILVDSGRYTYSNEKKERIELKKAKSHNTSIVNGKEFTECKGSWGNTKVATPIKGLYKFKENYDFVEGGHLGYINDENITFVNRKVIFIKPNIWILSDEFFTNCENEYNIFFNFNKDKVTLLNENKIKYEGKVVDFYLNSILKEDKNEKYKNYFTLEKNKISKDYNKVYESTRAILNLEDSKNTHVTTVMYGINKERSLNTEINSIDVYDWQGKLLDKNIAEGIRIKINNLDYTVLIVHKEEDKGRKLYIVNGHRVYGRVAIIDENKKEDGLTVLAY